MAQQRILVTGATGALGQELTARLGLFPQYHVLATTRAQLDLASGPEVIAHVLDTLKPDVIVNTAAFTAVDAAESQVEEAFFVNAHGPRALAEWSARHGAYLVHVSTDYVFNGTKGSLYLPDDLPEPINMYGRSKLAGETVVGNILPDTGAIVRTSWLYGPGSKNFVPFILNAARERRPIRVADDQWGTPTWTGTLCKMLFSVLQNRPAGILHGCCQGQTSRYQQALFLCEAIGANPGFMTPAATESFGFAALRPHNTAMQTSFSDAPTWQEATLKYLDTVGVLTPHA